MKMKEKVFSSGFAMLPNEIIDNPDINIYMQSVLFALYRFRNQETNTCFPSYPVIAQYAKCSERHAKRMVKGLEEMGIITVSRHAKEGKNPHASNVYHLPTLTTGFTMFPNEIMDNCEIDVYMQSVLSVLYRFRNKETNTCFPSYAEIAKLAKCCKRKAELVIKQLEEMELITVSRHENNGKNTHASNVYTIVSEQENDSDEKPSSLELNNVSPIKNKQAKSEIAQPSFHSAEQSPNVEESSLNEQQSRPDERQSPPTEQQPCPSESPSPKLDVFNNTESNHTEFIKNDLSKTQKKCYGKNQNVFLSDCDYAILQEEFPDDYETRIDKLSYYMKAHNKSYSDHLAIIHYYAINGKHQAEESKKTQSSIPDYSKFEQGASL